MVDGKHAFITLDGLRGVAAISVVFYHFSRLVGTRMLPNSLLSVDFFFMLSGFVLAYAYEERIRNGRFLFQFVKIRLMRLYPLYLLGITLPMVVILSQNMLGLPHEDVLCASLTYIMHVGFLPTPVNISFDPELVFPLNGPSWSLSAEIWINVLYAVVCSSLTTRRLRWLVILAGLGLVAADYYNGSMSMGWSWQNYWGGWTRVLWSFPAGVLLFRVFKKKKPGTNGINLSATPHHNWIYCIRARRDLLSEWWCLKHQPTGGHGWQVSPTRWSASRPTRLRY